MLADNQGPKKGTKKMLDTSLSQPTAIIKHQIEGRYIEGYRVVALTVNGVTRNMKWWTCQRCGKSNDLGLECNHGLDKVIA